MASIIHKLMIFERNLEQIASLGLLPDDVHDVVNQFSTLIKVGITVNSQWPLIWSLILTIFPPLALTKFISVWCEVAFSPLIIRQSPLCSVL